MSSWRNLAVMIVALGMMFGCALGSQAQDMAPEIKKWDMTYEGNALPTGCTACIQGDAITEVKDGVLRLADNGTGPGEVACYAYYWKAIPEKEATVETRVKVVFCEGTAAVYFGASNGRFEDFLTLYKDKIELHYAGLSYRMDTRDEFHTYRITIKDSDIKVYVDGELRIDGSGKLTQPSPEERNQMSFGSGTSPGTGEAYWDWVKYYLGGVVKTEKGTVKIEKTQIIFEFEEDVGFPWAARFSDGTIWVGFSIGVHPQTERGATVVSPDDGKTWKLGGVQVWPTGMWVGPDDRIIRIESGSPEPLRGTVYPLTVTRLDNPHNTKTEQIKSEVELPWAAGMHFDRSSIRTADGKLIASVYGRVKGEPRTRSYCIISDDEGKTWKFLSTIAYDPKIGSEEGYGEPVLARLSL